MFHRFNCPWFWPGMLYTVCVQAIFVSIAIDWQVEVTENGGVFPSVNTGISYSSVNPSAESASPVLVQNSCYRIPGSLETTAVCPAKPEQSDARLVLWPTCRRTKTLREKLNSAFKCHAKFKCARTSTLNNRFILQKAREYLYLSHIIYIQCSFSLYINKYTYCQRAALIF